MTQLHGKQGLKICNRLHFLAWRAAGTRGNAALERLVLGKRSVEH
jgi:hypothetical protein